MDKHTFIGKRKVGTTDLIDFTNYQGIGQDPLYTRYDSLKGVIMRNIGPEYAHFLAVPSYSENEDTLNWYIENWEETPIRLTELEGEERRRYERIKDCTLDYYNKTIETLNGEERTILRNALKYVYDEFIYCTDGKVHLIAWGMAPDNRHISIGELVKDSPQTIRHTVDFDPGEHGKLHNKARRKIKFRNGVALGRTDLPEIEAKKGYVHLGWDPEPLGHLVDGDVKFTATYEKTPPPPPTTNIPTPPPFGLNEIEREDPSEYECKFIGDKNCSVIGHDTIMKSKGSFIHEDELPGVDIKKGFVFNGWTPEPLGTPINQPMTFRAQYNEKIPWYKKIWTLFTEKGCLKWLLWLLLALLICFLIWLLFRSCVGPRAINGVREIDRVVTTYGDTIDNNGYVRSIPIKDGRLPDEDGIVAPIYEEDGELPPIERQPGVPPIIANRLFLFLEDESDSVDALAEDFKKAYPGEQYSIIGYDREVGSLVIQIPENERDKIRATIQEKIPNHRFLVFDEELYELNGAQSRTASMQPGWHLEAVRAPQGWAISKGSPSVIVAVVDDGIDPSHPMFKDRIVNPYNVYTQSNKLSQGSGHGTHIAALAVGSLDYLNQGAAGIAPDCRLMPIQVLDNNICPLSALVSGIMYAIRKDADVINVSIAPQLQGLNVLPLEVQDEIAQTRFKNVEKLWQRVCTLASKKNTIIVFAAGNDDIISSIPPENRTKVAITVGAVDPRLYPTEFTNFGPCTEISAPGVEILSAFTNGQLASFDGTSMAAPIVTGTIALMKTLKKDLTVAQARIALYNSGLEVYGYMPPMVQVDKALLAVKNGDYVTLKEKQLRPVPEGEIYEDGVIPDSWNDMPGPSTQVVIIDEDRGDNTADGSDYESIRRTIEMYKRKISELEKQLPENKR